MPEPAIEVTALAKSYGKVRVLDGVDLRVERGSVFSLLGPNGAGKTTTVRILATLIPADAGRARVAGFDVVRDRHRVRRAISLTGQYAAVDGKQTGAENLRMMARLLGFRRRDAGRRADDLLERFDLGDAGDRLVNTYSGGMRRRLDLAASLVGTPSVIFLDEPTTGLDVRSRQAMWAVITELAGSGVTVFLTTQYLEEADRLADRVAVLDAGKVVADDTPAALKQKVSEQRLDVTMVDPAAYDALGAKLGDRVVFCDPDRHVLGMPTPGDAAGVRAQLDELDPDRTTIRDFTVHTATLDDVFLALTGHATTPEQPDPEHQTHDNTTNEKEPAGV